MSPDLVYAIGVLGRHVPMDPYIVEKVRRFLKPGGRFVASASDRRTHEQKTWKRRILALILPVLPAPMQRAIRVRLCDLSLTEPQVRALFQPPGWRLDALTTRGSRKTEWVVQATRTEVVGL